MLKLTELEQENVSVISKGLLTAYKSLSKIANDVADIADEAGIFGSDLDDVLEPFILKLGESQDELTKLMGISITESLIDRP